MDTENFENVQTLHELLGRPKELDLSGSLGTSEFVSKSYIKYAEHLYFWLLGSSD